MAERRLLRSRTQRRIAGVCGGLAAYFDTDPVFIRLVFVGAVFIPPFAAAAIVGYVAAWIIVPEEEEAPVAGPAPSGPADAAGADFTEMNVPPGEAGFTTPPGVPASPAPTPAASGWLPTDASVVGGVIFIALGFFFLALNLGWLPWDLMRFWRWRVLWPVAVIVVGIAMLVQAVRWGGARSDDR